MLAQVNCHLKFRTKIKIYSIFFAKIITENNNFKCYKKNTDQKILNPMFNLDKSQVIKIYLL